MQLCQTHIEHVNLYNHIENIQKKVKNTKKGGQTKRACSAQAVALLLPNRQQHRFHSVVLQSLRFICSNSDFIKLNAEPTQPNSPKFNFPPKILKNIINAHHQQMYAICWPATAILVNSLSKDQGLQDNIFQLSPDSSIGDLVTD